MYLMYVDEAGDTGMKPGRSDYFILSGLVMHESYWYKTLTEMTAFRQTLVEKYGLSWSHELHAAKMVGRAKKSEHGLSRKDAVLLFRDVLRFEATLDQLRIINVVVDKREKSEDFDVFTLAWDRLVNRFENTIRHNNFPSAWEQRPNNEAGMLIVDETNEEKLRMLVRTMRHANVIPSRFGGMAPATNLKSVIEDPYHKQSELSLPIQFSDANAYFLLQWLAPNGTVRAYKAKNYFYALEPILCKQASASDPMGIVYA